MTDHSKDSPCPLLMSPFELGGQTLKNRMVLAPLTRARTDASRVPNAMMKEYYLQRASAGLVITEATGISKQGFGWHNAPGIYDDVMCAAWKDIVDAVHAKGSVIYLQLWHMGRQGHSSFAGEDNVVSASALKLDGSLTHANGEKGDYDTPRAVLLEEFPALVEEYRVAAEYCKKAGFDGVEVHAGNGYLLDQFLQKASNHRTDKYGGTHENQARLLMEVIEAVGTVYPMNRIGVRLSPNGAFGGMGHAENKELFPYVAKSLNKYGLGYLHIMDGLAFGFHKMCEPVTMADIRKVYDHPTMSNCGLTRDVAEGMIRSGTTDLACFGRLYVSNPDLVERYANDWPIAAPAPYESWWTVDAGAKGYTDWPAYTPEVEKLTV